MWHPDEGLLHAWIEEQLPADEAARVAAHVEGCGECQTAVAEARGAIAGASRVVGFLDNSVGAGTAISKSDFEGRLRTAASRGGFKRRWRTSTAAWTAVAATVVLAVGSMFVVRGRPGVEGAKKQLMQQEQKAPLIDSPIPQIQTSAAVVDTTHHQRRAREAGAASSHINAPVAKPALVDSSPKASAAEKTEAEPTAAHAQAATADNRALAAPAPQPAPPMRAPMRAPMAPASPAAAGLSGGAGARASEQQVVVTGAEMRAADIAAPASLIGCYELTPTAQASALKFAVLPSRFALSANDSSARRAVWRIVDGRRVEIPELTWMARGSGFVVSGGTAGSLVARVASGVATAFDSTGSQQFQIEKTKCP